ncbi:MAG: hypothetical protein LBI74_10320 [Synergistaceae bacterium]|jgi:hypothetical protein|nr:hypothetical protein [Synergistaceae bacterium]
MKKSLILKLALILTLTLAICGAPAQQSSAADGDLAVYQSVFDDLKNQIATEDYKWNGVQESSGLGGCALSDYRYLLRDMDSDGVDELFLFADDSGDGEEPLYSLIAVFTITNGEAKLLEEFWSRNRGYLTVGSYIMNEWSNGADDSGDTFYALSEGRLVAVDGDYKVDESIQPLSIPDTN